MIRKLIAAGALAVALIATPAVAEAKSVSCSTKTFDVNGDDGTPFPVVYKLRAIDMPAKTDGYAPRCLVASTAAMMVQEGWNGRTAKPPKTVRLQGARWNAGTWRVSMKTVTTDDGAYGKFTVRQGSKRITFEGGS